MDIKSVGIIGLGMVGGNLHRYFKELTNLETKGYDIAKESDTFDDVTGCDVIFVCVPTPYKEGKSYYDLTIMRDVLSKIPDDKVVVIKSTVLPGTTRDLQDEFNLRLAFAPEFLTERLAWEDTTHPDTSIVGYTFATYDIARSILNILPEAQDEYLMTATEAEYVKIARNNYFINKIVFMNTLYDTIEGTSDCDYEVVMKALGGDRRIRRSHMQIFHQGGRGGGGTCFTKDGPAWRDFVKKRNKRSYDFTDCYIGINQQLLKESKKDTGGQYEA